MIPAAENDYALSRINLLDLIFQKVDRAKVGGEDDDLLGRILTPKNSETLEQLLGLSFSALGKHGQQVLDPQALLRKMQIDRRRRDVLRICSGEFISKRIGRAFKVVFVELLG